MHLHLHEKQIKIHEYCEKIVLKLTVSIKTSFSGALFIVYFF